MSKLPAKPIKQKSLSDISPAGQPEPFFEEIDHGRAVGRGSWCTLWSLYLLFGTLLILGVTMLLWLKRGF